MSEAFRLETTMVKVIELSYGPSASHTIDLYLPASDQPKCIFVYVHGGAWRSGDKSGHVDLAQQVCQRTSSVVAVPNYRLSPRAPTETEFLHHPAHTTDLLDALLFLLDTAPWEAPKPSSGSQDDTEAPIRQSPKIILMGHSCGAHMVSMLFLQPPPSSAEPTLSVPDRLITSVRGILLCEGIYDIDLLLSTFPSYRDFIQGAFEDRVSYASVSPSTYVPRYAGEHIIWKVVHSKGDTLIDEPQADSMYSNLVKNFQPARVLKDYASLSEDHDAVLESSPIVEMIVEFLQHVIEDSWNVEGVLWLKMERDMFLKSETIVVAD